MPKHIKDKDKENLYSDPNTGQFYFRKYTTEVGEVCRSLKTKTRSVAIRRMNQILSEMSSFRPKEKKLSIDEVILEMYGIYQGQARATFENFEYFCRAYITPYFTGIPIAEVARQWKPFKAHVKRQKPGMSLLHIRKHMVSILNYAAELEYIEAAPKLKLDPGERIKRQPRAYDPDEVRRILTEAPPKKAKLKPRTVQKQRLQIRLVLFANLRPPQEIRHLKIEYIDFERGLIRLPAEIVKTRTEQTKSIDADTLTELKRWITRLPEGSTYVFPHRYDPSKPSTSSDKSWQRLKKALGFSGKRYWFRHSAATAAIEAGESHVAVTKEMGTSREMLDEIYVRPTKLMKERIANAVKQKYGFGRNSESASE